MPSGNFQVAKNDYFVVLLWVDQVVTYLHDFIDMFQKMKKNGRLLKGNF